MCGYNQVMETGRSTSGEQLFDIARRVVKLACATLYIDMPFLDVALFRLKFDPDTQAVIPSWATDGREVHYDARYVLGRYRESAAIITHDIMHVTLHCVFRHMFVSPQIDQRIWDIACDIAVESVIGSLNMKSLDDGRAAMRDAYLGVLFDLPDMLSAEKLYSTLHDADLSEADLDALEEAFGVDVHPWYLVDNRQQRGANPSFDEDEDKDANDGDQTPNAGDSGEDERDENPEGDEDDGEKQSAGDRESLEREWEDASRSVQTGLETMHGNRGFGAETDTLLQALKTINRKHYDYKGFLHSFSTWGEQLKIDEDEFDYVYYTFGLDHYGDMPLVEPLEYKDVKKLRDVAIVLDTSGSVRGEMLQTLFERTFDLISSENNAFRRFRIHLIQCDAQVTQDTVLNSAEELERALDGLEFKGLGGTDFSAAFDYVDKLVAEGAFVNFKGLIYFTDGRGTYPAACPQYKSAFVFVEDNFEDVDVPPWAIKIILTADEVRQL